MSKNMIKKIFNVLAKIVVGLFSFYLVVGFVWLPLASSWVIPWQGSKIFKTPVKVSSVFFNPVLLRLSINGLKILDKEKQQLLGFDRFATDVSFTNLFKKIYRIESVNLEGLKVNVALLPDGNINLLDLVPQATDATLSPGKAPSEGEVKSPITTAPTSAPQPSSQGDAMPLVIVDTITLSNGTVSFVDKSIQPNFSTTLGDMESSVMGFSTKPDSEVKVSFKAKIDQKGLISVEALAKPMMQPLDLETSFSLNDYAMQILSPYVGKYTGRSLGDGKLDIKMNYRISDNKLKASHKLLIQHFEFGQKVESKDALSLPFGLAIALLEDPQGKINIALPVKGDMSDPQFEYFHLIGQVVKNFFIKLVTKPFSMLASIVGGGDAGTDELGYVRFLPGKAGLPDEEKQKLNTLINGLKERPKLLLEINGSFDSEVDWKAIQKDVFTKDYDKLSKEISNSEEKVYQLLYQRRFGVRALWALAKKYKKSVGDYDHVKFTQEIKRQLIEHAPPDKEALSVLAQARAQLVNDFILSAGFDAKRLSIGQVRSTQSSMGFVPMEFTLTVYGIEKEKMSSDQ